MIRSSNQHAPLNEVRRVLPPRRARERGNSPSTMKVSSLPKKKPQNSTPHPLPNQMRKISDLQKGQRNLLPRHQRRQRKPIPLLQRLESAIRISHPLLHAQYQSQDHHRTSRNPRYRTIRKPPATAGTKVCGLLPGICLACAIPRPLLRQWWDERGVEDR